MNIKNTVTLIGLAACLLTASPCMAQKGIRQAQKALFLNNFELKLPRKVLDFHQQDIQALFLDSQIPAKTFGQLSVTNDREALLSLQRFVHNFDRFVKEGPAFIVDLQSKVFADRVPYGKLLPRDIDYLYIGEVHNTPRVQQEVEQLLTNLPGLYPGRHIYLATEFVFLNKKSRSHRSYDKLLVSRQELEETMGRHWNSSLNVVRAAVDRGIGVLGIEPEYELQEWLSLQLGRLPTADEMFAFAISPAGMSVRNEAWAKTIRRLRNKDPQALIVVYAGADHLGYHQEHSIPSFLGGKGFSALITDPVNMPTNNPLFRHIAEEPEKLEQFASSPNAKLVEYWKRPSKGTQILGWNMVVVLHGHYSR